jgi:2',3'-cyclic-nucleotide 2'-phosphodiesterase (5'-nucleotidase family)
MRTRISLLVLLSTGVLWGLGCEKSITGPHGEAVATYKGGALRTDVAAGISTTYQAAEKALHDLNLTVLQSTGGELGATIVARDPQDRKIQVDLIALSDKATAMTVNTGSKTTATRVYRAIVDNLPAPEGPTA